MMNTKYLLLFLILLMPFVSSVDFSNVDTSKGGTINFPDIQGNVLCNIKSKDLSLTAVKIPIDKYLSYLDSKSQIVSCQDKGSLRLEINDTLTASGSIKCYNINEISCYYQPKPSTSIVQTINSKWYNINVCMDSTAIYKSLRLVYSCEDEIFKN